MSTTITINISAVQNAKQPVLDALDDILASSIVPLQAQLSVTKALTQVPGVAPTQVAYTFPATIASDQVYNFYRRIKLETGILSTKITETVPTDIPQALSAVVFEVPANGQPV